LLSQATWASAKPSPPGVRQFSQLRIRSHEASLLSNLLTCCSRFDGFEWEIAMANRSELVQRLRALSMKLASLEVTVGRCARELESLVELAIRLDHNPRSPNHPPAQFHAGRFIVDCATFSVSDGTRDCRAIAPKTRKFGWS